MITTQTFIFALAGGILPALVWLWFWRKEDRHPEPRRLILLAFVMGMLSVPFVIPFQKYSVLIFSGTTLIIAWAAIEEILKYLFAHFSVLRRKEVNEPIDPIIYVITVALGFAALENALFLIDPLTKGGVVQGILTGNFRFFGAMLLHVLSSATIGVFISLSLCKSAAVRRALIACGIILAIALHSMFNFFIIKSNGTNMLLVFGFVWAGIIILLLILEKIKRITNVCLSYIKRN